MIVLDHADFDVEWFQDAVRQRWRDGEALIPESWIDPDVENAEQTNTTYNGDNSEPETTTEI